MYIGEKHWWFQGRKTNPWVLENMGILNIKDVGHRIHRIRELTGQEIDSPGNGSEEMEQLLLICSIPGKEGGNIWKAV